MIRSPQGQAARRENITEWVLEWVSENDLRTEALVEASGDRDDDLIKVVGTRDPINMPAYINY
jgi:hypothetical protein